MPLGSARISILRECTFATRPPRHSSRVISASTSVAPNRELAIAIEELEISRTGVVIGKCENVGQEILFDREREPTRARVVVAHDVAAIIKNVEFHARIIALETISIRNINLGKLHTKSPGILSLQSAETAVVNGTIVVQIAKLAVTSSEAGKSSDCEGGGAEVGESDHGCKVRVLSSFDLYRRQ